MRGVRGRKCLIPGAILVEEWRCVDLAGGAAAERQCLGGDPRKVRAVELRDGGPAMGWA